MGVDFFPCAYCEETICDCGEYLTCENCRRHFCNEKCANMKYDEEGEEVSQCRYCQGIDATTEQLLEFLMKKKKITIEKLREMYVKEFKK